MPNTPIPFKGIGYIVKGKMRWEDIEKKARAVNIRHPGRYSKTDLIKTIQKAEGNFDCFGAGLTYCDQYICFWRKDCLK